MSKMPDGHVGQRKRPQKGARIGPELVSAATQVAIRAILDALIWWLDRGGRL